MPIYSKKISGKIWKKQVALFASEKEEKEIGGKRYFDFFMWHVIPLKKEKESEAKMAKMDCLLMLQHDE